MFSGFEMDVSGPRDASFLRNLRDFVAERRSQPNCYRFLSTTHLCGVLAAQVLRDEMTKLRAEGFPLHECVGDDWCVYTLTPGEGFVTHAEAQLLAGLGAAGFGARVNPM